MADISVEQKQGGNFTWLWAAAAIVAVLGLMIWLFTTQTETTQVVTEGTATDTVAEAAAGPEETGPETAELGAIGATPDEFVGREVQVPEVEVAAVLGQRGFWANIPGANPFLVILQPEVADTAWIEGGATATLEGTVEQVTDTVLDQWVEAEAIRTAARDEASFATHYLNVSQVEQ